MGRLLLLVLATTAITGCVVINTPVTGAFYNDSKGPTTLGTGEGGSKTGTACTTGVFGFVFGDASIETAKKDGGITKVTYVDHTATTVLAVYGKYCTLVHGD